MIALQTFAAVLLLALATCKGEQSLHDGIAALCELPAHVPDSGERYDKRVRAAYAWAEAHVTNPDARKLGGFHSLPANTAALANAVAASKDELAKAVAATGIASCKLLDNDLALQSFPDAMAILCTMPTREPDRATWPAYFEAHLLNPEAIAMFASIGDAEPRKRARVFAEAAARARLASCPLAEEMAAKLAVP